MYVMNDFTKKKRISNFVFIRDINTKKNKEI